MSQSNTKTEQNLPRWDLDDLYFGSEDPKLDDDLATLERSARSFRERFEPLIDDSLSVEDLKSALDSYEEMLRSSSKIGSYASLYYSTDTLDPKRGALLQKVREKSSRIATELIFFSLRIGRLSEESFQRFLEADALEQYHHYLTVQREEAKHHLSQTEETVLEETANYRGRAFRRLFTEVVSRMRFPFEVDGELKRLTQAELLAYNYHPDRALRRKASESLGGVLEENAPVLTFTMNTLLAEKEMLDRLRGFESPEAERHLDNELPAAAVNTMVEVCVQNFSLVEEYYRLKRDLLGLDSLAHFDRYAPLQPSEQQIAYAEAKRIVLEAYRAFSPELHDLALPFFEENWIDVPVVPGKRGGAFCAGVSPDHHPYILLNYTSKPRDVMTLAHELGHGVHDRLAAENHILDYHPVLPLAETASTFGEMLTFEKLYGELDSDEDRLALLCEKLEDTFATVFRQVSMYRFEQAIHQARRTEGELPTERLNELWQEKMQEMFGDSLTLGPEHRWTWLYIPHIIQTPFYVYAYAFGELLVLSLYARYKRDGESFRPAYFDLLRAGGSRSPRVLLEELGIDVADASFWQGGCDLIKENLKRARSLAERLKA